MAPHRLVREIFRADQGKYAFSVHLPGKGAACKSLCQQLGFLRVCALPERCMCMQIATNLAMRRQGRGPLKSQTTAWILEGMCAAYQRCKCALEFSSSRRQ